MNKFKELIKSYEGSSPLFFYEECVLFPKVENNFIITDQNYIDMIKSVLVNNRFITVSLKKKDNKRLRVHGSQIYDIGTLGYIVDFKEINNGKYLLFVLGLNKVQINETEKTQPYRIVATSPLFENTDIIGEKNKKEHLIKRLETLIKIIIEEFPIQIFNDQKVSLEILINMICSYMLIPSKEKQKLLELQDINLRYEILIQFIDGEISNSKQSKVLSPILPTLMD